MSVSEDAKHIRETLKLVPVGQKPKEIEGAKAFYQFMFTNFSDLRKYFKGAETFTADDIAKSERFEKQGQRLLLAVHLLANTYEDDATFRAYARETINRHRQFKMDPALWSAFFDVYIAFLETRGQLSTEQKAAWKNMGKVFDEECQAHLKALGLPHV